MLLNLVPDDPRGVPFVVAKIDMRRRRRTLLTTELVKNHLPSMLNVGTLRTGLEVLLVDLDIHAQNNPLKPVQILHLLLDERRASMGSATSTSIAHK
jgi:hypothetical protein